MNTLALRKKLDSVKWCQEQQHGKKQTRDTKTLAVYLAAIMIPVSNISSGVQPFSIMFVYTILLPEKGLYGKVYFMGIFWTLNAINFTPYQLSFIIRRKINQLLSVTRCFVQSSSIQWSCRWKASPCRLKYAKAKACRL